MKMKNGKRKKTNAGAINTRKMATEAGMSVHAFRTMRAAKKGGK